ncbi:hypothetical protein [Endothiovibrio diazotrophicus]
MSVERVGGGETVVGIRGGSEGTIANANDAAMDRFAASFEASAKRWELVVYPSLVAFIILAVYGFYLVYSLTSDVAQLAKSIDPAMEHHMAEMTISIQQMSTAVSQMSDSVSKMNVTLQEMSGDVDNLGPMLGQMEQMTRYSAAMAGSTDRMGQDLAIMNRNVSPAMRGMNNLMPW